MHLRSVKQNIFGVLFLESTAHKACVAVGVTLLILTIGGLARGRGLPAQQGIRNFGQINEELYRGAQPDAAGILSLKRLGVKTIIDLRMSKDAWKQEAAVARANGIVYTNVPFKGTGRPRGDQVASALAIIQTSPGPVFVHCRHGCDRTGTVIACYRIRHDGWSSEAALAEARRYGMSKFERGMRSCIVEFGKKAKATESQPKLPEAAVQN